MSVWQLWKGAQHRVTQAPVYWPLIFIMKLVGRICNITVWFSALSIFFDIIFCTVLSLACIMHINLPAHARLSDGCVMDYMAGGMLCCSHVPSYLWGWEYWQYRALPIASLSAYFSPQYQHHSMMLYCLTHSHKSSIRVKKPIGFVLWLCGPPRCASSMGDRPFVENMKM